MVNLLVAASLPTKIPRRPMLIRRVLRDDDRLYLRRKHLKTPSDLVWKQPRTSKGKQEIAELLFSLWESKALPTIHEGHIQNA